MNINASRCIDYLRAVGVVVTDETAAAWVTQEKDHRAANRARNRELKRSCGHFRTHVTTIYSEAGREDMTTCSDCYRYVQPRPKRRRA